jgi:hypothetical protein
MMISAVMYVGLTELVGGLHAAPVLTIPALDLFFPLYSNALRVCLLTNDRDF